jgi:pyruvate,water dikinase
MSLAPIWGALVVFLVCPILGGLPLIDWITYGLTGRQLTKLGTGNISVSAAFYHGGKLAGICAVLSEAAKGIIAVWLVRVFFPPGSVWEILALIALVMGRYVMGKGAGTTNAVWGIMAHDAQAAGLVFLISLVSFTIIRDRQQGKLGALVLLSLIIGLRHPQAPEYAVAAIALSSLLAWIYHQIPDDLNLDSTEARTDSQAIFRFFRGEKTIITLNRKLEARKVGNKAANLALLKQLGYNIPDGWVLQPGEDFKPLLEVLTPSPEQPLVVRSSAIGEDSLGASAAGQYLSVLDITSTEALQRAILDCQVSYLQSNVQQYRRDRQQTDRSMAILIQQQIEGQYSGVAFSRDPVDRFSNAVSIEALPGKATKVVSGKFTPYQYRVEIPTAWVSAETNITVSRSDARTQDLATIPQDLIESVGLLARELEELFDNIPQDMEWTYDGEKLWLLQVRPITTLQPIWTRRIAAEVIPGTIHPLTWSINRPLTCGVWGKLFTIVLGTRARDLDFNQTATLHFSRAYFNATLLGTIFRRMGLPAESLEFLTRGEKFSKPPLKSTLRNLPGLWRLLQKEWHLEKDWQNDLEQLLAPSLEEIGVRPPQSLSGTELYLRIKDIIALLETTTYYSILAPLSLALRQAIWSTSEAELDNSQIPEIAATRSLADLAADTRKLLAAEQITMQSTASLFAYLAENPEGTSIMERFERWLNEYGYLSEIATDIAIPRWQDRPAIPREMFAQFFFDTEKRQQTKLSSKHSPNFWSTKLIQSRLNLKGQVGEVYNKLLAHLRWSYLALGRHWMDSGILNDPETIFWLDFTEIENAVEEPAAVSQPLSTLIAQRQAQWQQHQKIASVPYLVYGNPESLSPLPQSPAKTQTSFRGIGTSPGQIEGSITIITSLKQAAGIDKQTIIVVPYTDAGWLPILARAGGLIAEVGGRLSHGAIIAREYQIPAVMDIPDATQIFKPGQRVRIDGISGLVEILDRSL